MLADEQVVRTVADFLSRARLPHVVLDPILGQLREPICSIPPGRKLMIERLFPLTELVTPNLDEAAALGRNGQVFQLVRPRHLLRNDLRNGRPGASVAASVEAMREAARRLHSLGAANVVVTGGHLEKAIDLLSFTTAHGIEQEVFKAERQRSTSTHGTGCAFATALACHLAHGRGLPEAVLLSKAYVSAAIANAYPLGHGAGPLHHLYRMHEQRRPSQVVPENEHAHSRNRKAQLKRRS